MLKGCKLHLIFVKGISWFHEVLKRIQFAGRLTLQHAMNARVKICISRQKGVKCGRCHPFYSGTSCLSQRALNEIFERVKKRKHSSSNSAQQDEKRPVFTLEPLYKAATYW